MVTHVGAQGFDAHSDPERDIPSRITMPLDGNVLVIQRYDPYGFWRMHLEKGNLPGKYTGQYTDIRFIKSDAAKYIAEREAVQAAPEPVRKRELKPRMTADEFEAAREIK